MFEGTRIRPDDERYEVFNPANGESLGFVEVYSEDKVKAVIAKARQAQVAWAARSDAERCELLHQVADALAAHEDELARWVTQEQGKPIEGLGSRFEAQGCVAWTRAALSYDIPEEVVHEDDERRDVLVYEPRGVVAAIAPWNWPLMIGLWQVIPALRMGNAAILKPSEYTSLATIEMVKIINQVLPEGVLSVVTGGGSVGGWLTSSPDVNKIMFTGSEATGRRVVEATRNNLAPITLELGGNDAAIILPGAPVKAMAEGIFWGAFINMGQTCACAKRLYVQEDDFDDLLAALKDIAGQMKIGNGEDNGVTFGPIQNRMQYNKVMDLVADSRDKGHNIIEVGDHPDTGFFMPITFVTGLKDGDRLVDEEQFGPVLPIIKYQTLDEAIASANRLDVGLGASVWGDPDEATRVARRIKAGTVWINQHGLIHPLVPFGGAKSSGYGLEFGLDGLKAVAQPKVISLRK